MRPLLAVLASLLFVQAMHGDSFTVRIQETVVIEIFGATAAYTTNPLIADVIIAGASRLSVTGHSSGTTQLMVITASGTQSFLITVAAAPLPLADKPEAGAPQARYDGRYSSGVARVQNTVDLITHDGDRTSEFHILHVHELRAAPGQAADPIASIFYRITSPAREVTFLDSMVDASRMTVSNTEVRGIHLRQGALELHAGYASTAMYDDFFLAAGRRWVAGGGYSIDTPSIRWTPSVYGFFSEPANTAARRGIVGALSSQYLGNENLFMRADVGVSRSIAAAGELRYVSARGQVRALLSFKPDDFPTLGLADIRGSHGELDWTRLATGRLSIATHGTYDRFNLGPQNETIGAGSLGIRYGVTRRLSLLAGEDFSSIRTPAASIRTIGVPAGLAYESPAFGAAGTYRWLKTSGSSRSGDSVRVSARLTLGSFSSDVWAERQRQAPTLDLIFRDEPGLELALLRLGIAARSPEDVARALRDNASLIDLGFITGVNVDLTPRRLQGGLNLGWFGAGARSNHLRLVTVYSRDDGIRTTSDSLIASVIYSRRILSATDLYGSYSWWRTTITGQQQRGTGIELGLRQQFNGLPRFMRGSGTVEGFAFLDPEMSGVRGPATEPLPDIAVMLDNAQTVRTDLKGAYAFRGVSPGPHRVSAELPSSARAFFTTPSNAEAKVGARVDFGVVWAAARIDGSVNSDARIGISGVVLSAAGQHGPAITTTSDHEGRFVFAVPPGVFRVGLQPESLPPGYSIAPQVERIVTAAVDRPQTVAFDVVAQRSISGRATGASEVRIDSLGRTAVVDPRGNFVFRAMPAGTFTVAAKIGGRTIRHDVTLPDEPAVIQDVLSVSIPDGAYVVQTGAFREERNVRELIGRLQRNGEKPFTAVTRGLTFVYVGPFETRRSAVAANERLRVAGFEGFTKRR